MTHKFKELSRRIWETLREMHELPVESPDNPFLRAEYEHQLSVARARYEQALYEAIRDVATELLDERERARPRR